MLDTLPPLRQALFLLLRDPRQPGTKHHQSLSHSVKPLNLFALVFRLIKDSVHHLQTLQQSGADRHDAWNQTTVIHLQAAKVSCPSAEAKRNPLCFLLGKSELGHYAPALLCGCPHFTSTALVPGILIKGFNSKAILLAALREKRNEVVLLDLLQVVQIFPPR